jgi:hypothetical protein
MGRSGADVKAGEFKTKSGSETSDGNETDGYLLPCTAGGGTSPFALAAAAAAAAAMKRKSEDAERARQGEKWLANLTKTGIWDIPAFFDILYYFMCQ